ncbi:MAG: 50S ribosomal protein L9 [Bacilli bacterium]|nr:50S ribosomal protein L9 [Bacilli bacterium]
MKVILLADVKGVGKKNQQIEVSDGYASNYLIPRKLAVKVSEKSVQILAQQQEDARIAYEKAKKDAIELGEKLKTITLEFKLKLGANGRVFGSISFKQVEEQLKNKYKIIIDKRKIITKGPIDSLGITKLEIELFKGVIGIINVHVGEE